MPNYVEGELENKPCFQKLDHKGAYNNHDSNNETYSYDKMSEYEHKLVKASYYAMIELIDTQVGRLIDCLEANGQLDNTLIIFMSDHGEMLGDHGIYLKGPYFYEGAVKVPLIMSYPEKIKKGIRSKALVELMDIAPTLAEFAGMPAQKQMQGKSLLGLLTGRSSLDEHKTSVYSEYYNSMPWHKNPTAFCTMVCDGRYKLVAVHGQNEGELYDLKQDSNETTNRWYDPNYATIKMEMLIKLNDKMAFTVDPMGERLSEW